MAAKIKKFGSNGLNALDSAIETVTEAVENQQTESSQVVASASVVESAVETASQPTIATKQEQTNPIEPSPIFSPIHVSPSVQPTAQQPTVAVVGAEGATQEDVKGLNVPLPLSVYKRLSTLKIDSDGETLKSLGLKAIIEFLNKSGY